MGDVTPCSVHLLYSLWAAIHVFRAASTANALRHLALLPGRRSQVYRHLRTHRGSQDLKNGKKRKNAFSREAASRHDSDLLSLDNADAFNASICIKLSRAQLLDAPEQSHRPRCLPDKLCGGSNSVRSK